jgi:hypothetical protein
VKFEWTPKCEDIFQQLKDISTSAPILNIADPDEDFVVCTDACKEGLGGILTQKYHVVCYETKKLKEHERNYATHDLELSTIVHALKMSRHYLMGKKNELRTDHCGLKHLFGQPTLNAKQTRWLEFLSDYDSESKHIKGKDNQVVDSLNKRAHEIHIASISMYMTDMRDKIIATTNSNQHFLQIKEALQQGNFQQKFNYYELKEDGILMYKGKVYVPNSNELKNAMPREMHNVSYARNPRYQKIITVVRSQYFWPRIKKEVVNYIAKCLDCQKVKNGHRHPSSMLQPFSIPEWKWEVVIVDFNTKLPKIVNQHDSIMVVVDKLTKEIHFIPVNTTHKATNIA